MRTTDGSEERVDEKEEALNETITRNECDGPARLGDSGLCRRPAAVMERRHAVGRAADLEVHPFQQVARHEILEPDRVGRHNGPVQVVVFLLLLHRPDTGRPERRHAKDRVQPLERRDPGGCRLVADLQVFPQRVDRQRRADQLGQAKHEEFELTQVLDALE